jgi:TonB family protein
MEICPNPTIQGAAMRPLIISSFAVLLILAGCTTTQVANSPADQPELVTMTSLPLVAPNFPTNGLRLKVLFHVMGNGSVAEVRFLGSSGDPDWDHAAIDSMKQWRFVMENLDSAQAGRWIRNTIILQVQEPTVLTLGELNAKSQQMADSLYALLQNGSDFDALIKQVTPGTSSPIGRFIGAVDIARYPKHVRDQIRQLGINEISRPIRVGTNYTIYKRYKPDGLLDLPQ